MAAGAFTGQAGRLNRHNLVHLFVEKNRVVCVHIA